MQTKIIKESRNGWLEKSWVIVVLAVFCNALWGSAFPCVKLGYEMFGIPGDSPASQILFAGMRFALAGVQAIFFGSLLQRKMPVPKKSSWGMIGKLALFQTILQYIFFYLGLAHTTGVKGSIIVASNTFITILVASLIFRQEKLTGRKTAACAVGFAGVVLVNLNGGGFDMNMRFDGEGFLLLAVLAAAFAACMMKIYSREEDPIVLSGYQFLLGGLVMVLAGFLMGGRIYEVSWQGILMLLYLGFISSAAFTVWSVLLKHHPVSKIAIFSFTNPVFGVMLSAIFLHEKNVASGWKIAAALVLVCIGICLVNMENENIQQ